MELKDIVERVTRKNKDLETKRPLTISAQYGLIDQESFFNKTVASANLSNYYLLKKGEFAYNKSHSSDYPWGAIKRLDNYPLGALSTLYLCFKPDENIVSDYLVHYFESPRWHNQVSNIAGEGARNHGLLNIAVGDFFATKHFTPKIKAEQIIIAEFLNLITKRIEIQIRAIEKLESLMKGLLGYLFKTVKSNAHTFLLGDICNITTGKLDANAMVKDGEYAFFTCAEKPYRIDKYAFDTEALLVSGNGNVGYINYYKGKFNAYQRTYVLSDFSHNISYIKYYLKAHLHARIDQEKNIGNIPYIVLSTLADMKIMIPHANIVDKIVRLLDSVEGKISRESNLLNHYINQKQYLLQEMFI